MTSPAGYCESKIFEVSPGAFELLMLLADWTDPMTLTVKDLKNLLGHLSANEFIEGEP